MTGAPSGGRPLGLLDVTCIGINAIVGSSIFLFPGRMAGLLGPASVLAFGLVGLLLIPVGLCFAEASSGFDRAGGAYLYAREAFGDRVGFAIGWMCWITQVISWAAVANGIAVYLGHFSSAYSSAGCVKAVAAVAIVSLGALNYRGVKLGAWASNFFTAAKLIPLIVFIGAGLFCVRTANLVPFAPHGTGSLGAACFLAYFAFQGFEVVPVPSGEVDRPQRNIPLAVIASILIATVLYMAVQAVAVGAFPGLAGSPRPLADAAQAILGPWGGGLIVLGAVFSTTGYNAGAALVVPRYLVALAEDGSIPGRFCARHPRFGTPAAAVLTTTAASLLLAMALDFDKLVDFSNVVVCAQYLSTCVAVPLLRRKRDLAAPPHPGPQGSESPLGRGSAARGFRLPGGWAIPMAGIAATLWLGAQASFAEIGWSFGALLLGFALRAGSRARLRVSA